MTPTQREAALRLADYWSADDWPGGLSGTKMDETAALLRELASEPVQARADCPDCQGSGSRDSGGTTPWGEPVYLQCDCSGASSAEPRGEPVATLHGDGYWTPKQSEAGRWLNDQLMRAGTRVDVYAHPPQQRMPLTWQPMETAPKNGWGVLVLLECDDMPHGARWLTGKDDPHATKATEGPGWHLTWDGSPVAEHDGPRYWMHCPNDPDVGAPT